MSVDRYSSFYELNDFCVSMAKFFVALNENVKETCIIF